MSSGLKVYFFVYSSKINVKGTAPLIMRLKFQKQTAQICTGFSIRPSNWQSDKYQVRTSENNSSGINQHIKDLQLKVHRLFSQMFQNDEVYLQNIIDNLKGNEQAPLTLKVLVEKYNNVIKERVGVDYKIATYKKYKITESKISDYLHFLGKKDIRLKELNLGFIDGFNSFMKQHYGNDQNTTCKHLKILKTYVKHAVSLDYLLKSPFENFKVTYRPKEKPYLTLDELKRIENKKFNIPRLQIVKDLFLIQCYTGLSFSDLYELKGENVSVGIDGNIWIIKNRIKTNVRSAIPLLPKAIELISKYNKNFNEKPKELLLPVYKIQRYNSYLKEIADLCEITKSLSSHAGRRTFASTIALGNGISIESIAQMLGHSNTRITHQYARVSDLKVANEMKMISNKFT